MIRRIYIFIILGTLIENCHYFFTWMGVSDETAYYTIFPVCQRLEIILLPLWWIWQKLSPAVAEEKEMAWAFHISATYFVFQLIDVVDMATNENLRSSTLDFILFISLNLSYWFIFRKKS